MNYQVGNITIEPARYRVRSGDRALPVEPKVFDLLVHLIRHRDRVLTREELFRDVWNGREVSDATLSNHVMAVRKLLGDNGDQQQAILTVRGRGYQFVAPVHEVADGDVGPAPAIASDTALPRPVPSVPAPDASAAPRPGTRRLLPALALVVLLLAGVAGAWHWLVRTAPTGGADLPYVLVVPFEVAGNAPEAWRPFADQATREVIRNLRKISGMRVVPASAFTFKGNKAREHVRAQLPEVRYVLDGAVSIFADNTLRITAELEDLAKGRVVWDHGYEGRTDDTKLFAMQSQSPPRCRIR